jgi:hypothetical protein
MEPGFDERQHNPRAGEDRGVGEDHDAEGPAAEDGGAAVGEVAGADEVY